MNGRIHSFQSLGTVDGPGVRSVVFMQGCPLRCICCHNPDTWDVNGGELVDSNSLAKKVLRFSHYYGELGGLTVSGGEPLLQAAFVTELFKKVKEHGVHTVVDTSGCLWNDDVKQLLAVTDMVLLDYKYASAQDYKQYVGCDIEKVDFFLEQLQKRNTRTWIRRVIIPGYSDKKEDTIALKELQNKFPCVEKVELLPFRKLCVEKYEALNIPFPLVDTAEPTEEQMKELNSLL